MRKAAPLPAFPALPEFSSEFYCLAPKADLDKLLDREIELTKWKKAVERRLKE